MNTEHLLEHAARFSLFSRISFLYTRHYRPQATLPSNAFRTSNVCLTLSFTAPKCWWIVQLVTFPHEFPSVFLLVEWEEANMFSLVSPTHANL